MVFNEFYNSSPDLLAVFLLILEEGMSNQIFRVENGRR
jgi:hypothetical protein